MYGSWSDNQQRVGDAVGLGDDPTDFLLVDVPRSMPLVSRVNSTATRVMAQATAR